jgi:hypothetical protein
LQPLFSDWLEDFEILTFKPWNILTEVNPNHMKQPTYLLAFIDFDFTLTDVLGELLQGRQKELGKWLRLSWHRRQRHGHPDYLFDAFGICWFQMLDEGVVVLEAGWALFSPIWEQVCSMKKQLIFSDTNFTMGWNSWASSSDLDF